jgi:hypothetical protein
MPIAFDIEALRQEHQCSIYIETGLWDPRDNVSSKQALAANFDRVYCVEIRQDWVDLGRAIFANEIATQRYHLICDDSTNLKAHIDNIPLLKTERAMFFLDAHVDNSAIKNYKKLCPLIDELLAIQSLPRNDHVILIDDLRILKQPHPWNEHSYGKISFIEMIRQVLLKINPEYKFKLLNGIVPNDVLCAYV